MGQVPVPSGGPVPGSFNDLCFESKRPESWSERRAASVGVRPLVTDVSCGTNCGRMDQSSELADAVSVTVKGSTHPRHRSDLSAGDPKTASLQRILTAARNSCSAAPYCTVRSAACWTLKCCVTACCFRSDSWPERTLGEAADDDERHSPKKSPRRIVRRGLLKVLPFAN